MSLFFSSLSVRFFFLLSLKELWVLLMLLWFRRVFLLFYVFFLLTLLFHLFFFDAFDFLAVFSL
jgi:hypothetical protein